MHCKKIREPLILKKDLNSLTEADFNSILSSGYYTSDYAKLWSDDQNTYDSFYFMNMEFSEEFLKQSCEEILTDSACGQVFRIKGFQNFPDGRWLSIHATHQGTEIHPVESGQEVLIVIGENLNKEAIEQYWGKSK